MFNFLPGACALMTSYLSGRWQCVRYGSVSSELGELTVGVPQGSVLGPLLFLLYVNDFPGLFAAGDTLLYADDTTIFSAGACIEDAVRARAGRMGVVGEWYNANQLALNEGKTDHVMFTLRRHSNPGQETKFLGVLLDTELTWRPHCELLSRRLSSAAFALRRLSESVSSEVARVAYFALFQAHLTYGLLSWGHAAASDRVFSVQRRVVRLLDGLGYRDDCRQSFVRLRLLTLPSLYIFECMKHMLNREDLRFKRNVHRYNTRGNVDIRLDSLRLTQTRNATNYYGDKIYNTINPELRKLSPGALLNKLKAYLVGKAFYSIDEFIQSPQTGELAP